MGDLAEEGGDTGGGEFAGMLLPPRTVFFPSSAAAAAYRVAPAALPLSAVIGSDPREEELGLHLVKRCSRCLLGGVKSNVTGGGNGIGSTKVEAPFEVSTSNQCSFSPGKKMRF